VIGLVANYRAQPGEEDIVAGLIARMVGPSTAEPGCRAYIPHRSPDDPAEFLLYEQYTDQAALDAHRASPHFVDIVQGQIIPRLASRTVAFYEPIAPAGT
jgi:quinol monooxygenase YgiN